MSETRDSDMFQALVFQLAQAGWMALGKIPNPVEGKIDRNLALARVTIDTLGALESRTRGNLSSEEKALLDRTLRELRLNYVDELKKDEPQPPSGAPREDAAPADAPPSEAPQEDREA